jgi:saccharopine dehydrogenase-like NADP-dependent oxidoreductase
MKNILIFGAGRSATSLIEYLIQHAETYNWQVWVADASYELVMSKIGNHPRAKGIHFLADDTQKRREYVQNADVVVSMLPVSLHNLVVQDCIEFKKSFFNASYISNELRSAENQILADNLLFLGEMGLDPGIDHMSAMKIIDKLHAQNAQITSFKSYTGGLVAPAHDTNPWGYKFSWNPRNVVVAGQNTAKYLYQNKFKYVPYQRLFAEAESVTIQDKGLFEIYPNRDSLSYQKAYKLEQVPTLLRATLRQKGFSAAWNVLVQLGLTDDTYQLDNLSNTTYKEFFTSFLSPEDALHGEEILEQVHHKFQLHWHPQTMEKLTYLNLWSDELIGLSKASPAQVLQHRLEQLWKLEPHETDMVIMQHEFEYVKDNQPYRLTSTLVQEGKDATHTAMSNLVGLPLAIAIKCFLIGEIQLTGLHLPILPEIYNPVLAELDKLGVRFKETTQAL